MKDLFTQLLATEKVPLDNVVLVEAVGEFPAGMALFKQALLASAQGNASEVVQAIKKLRIHIESYVEQCAIAQGVFQCR